MATVTEHIAVTAVTDAGRESLPARTMVIIADGVLAGPPPNPVAYAAARPAAAGSIQVDFSYCALGSPGKASAVEIVEVPASGPLNWTTPLATAGVGRRTTHRTVTLAGPWADGATVRLAVRAVTTSDIGGPIRILAPIVARGAGPAAVKHLEVTQIE